MHNYSSGEYIMDLFAWFHRLCPIIVQITDMYGIFFFAFLIGLLLLFFV